MKLFGYQISREETRNSPENPRIPVSAANFLSFFGVSSGNLPAVTIDSALQVPAVAAAVNFLSSTLANLPLHLFRDTSEGPVRAKTDLQVFLNEAPNPEWSSFEWRKYIWAQVFLGGRGLSWIERDGSAVKAIWPMEPNGVIIKRVNGRKIYEYEGKTYDAANVIDVPFMLKPDQISCYSPLVIGAKAIQLSIAMNDYAANFFAGGGVPPLALVGPLPTGPEAFKRAMAEVHRAVDEAKKSSKPIFPMPPGHDLKPVGFDPEKGQMTEARRFQIEEIGRLYNLPPVFLQDLTHGTFSNTEQQDLHLVKHTVAQRAKQFEDELNLKLFGQMRNKRYVEHNMNALLRGDLKSQMDALARGVQTALLTPDEGRDYMNRPKMAGGDKLYIQGATVPLEMSGKEPAGSNGATQNDNGTQGA